jgi:hypothetical protein
MANAPAQKPVTDPQTPLPLSRLTVLDLTLARAGPTCVRHLADWGANIIEMFAKFASAQPNARSVGSGKPFAGVGTMGSFGTRRTSPTISTSSPVRQLAFFNSVSVTCICWATDSSVSPVDSR